MSIAERRCCSSWHRSYKRRCACLAQKIVKASTRNAISTSTILMDAGIDSGQGRVG